MTAEWQQRALAWEQQQQQWQRRAQDWALQEHELRETKALWERRHEQCAAELRGARQCGGRQGAALQAALDLLRRCAAAVPGPAGALRERAAAAGAPADAPPEGPGSEGVPGRQREGKALDVPEEVLRLVPRVAARAQTWGVLFGGGVGGCGCGAGHGPGHHSVPRRPLGSVGLGPPPPPALPVPRGSERPMSTAACGGRGFKG